MSAVHLLKGLIVQGSDPVTVSLSTLEQIGRGLLNRCGSTCWVLRAGNDDPLAFRWRNTISLTYAFDFILCDYIILRDHRYIISRCLWRGIQTWGHRLALSQKCVYTSRCVRGIKAWE